MAKYVYSYNGSFVKLLMDEELANAYNRAMDAWFQAQRDFEATHGRKPTPEEMFGGKVQITMSGEEYRAWNKVADYMNKRYANGLQLSDADCTSSYLEKL